MPETIAEIKKQLSKRVGDEIEFVAQTGRKKTKTAKGVLAETFPAIFIVDLDPNEKNYERASFSYTDVLTHSVKITFPEDGFEVGATSAEEN